MAHPIDVWLTTGSTYTYLTAHRLRAAAERGVVLCLKPMYLGRIFNELGSWPFKPDSPKTRYMWQDIARRADKMNLSPVLPAPYPAPQTERANRVFYLAEQAGAGLEWLSASYAAWYQDGLMPGEDAHLTQSLAAAGLDAEHMLAQECTAEVDAALVSLTEEAKTVGVFGAPSFVVEGELFWGDDRFESALAHAGWA